MLAVVFAVSAVFVMYFALRGHTVEVPSVIGKSEAEAEEVLDDYGLRMGIRTRVHSDQYSQNAVTDQDPSPGKAVKTGQLVRVTLSLGANRTSSNASGNGKLAR